MNNLFSPGLTDVAATMTTSPIRRRQRHIMSVFVGLSNVALIIGAGISRYSFIAFLVMVGLVVLAVSTTLSISGNHGLVDGALFGIAACVIVGFIGRFFWRMRMLQAQVRLLIQQRVSAVK